MIELTLEEAIKKIQPLDKEAMAYTHARWNTLGKPLYSLGRLEEMVTQFAGTVSYTHLTLPTTERV